MSEFIITPFDGVPEPPRGYVRDLHLRWVTARPAVVTT